MAVSPPQGTKDLLDRQLSTHARERWPQLSQLRIRYRGAFAYVDAVLPDGDIQPLMRLRYFGTPMAWGFALHLASTGKYEDSILPTGSFTGTAEETLDCACELYLMAPDF
jgi:hypothetical protein